MHWELPVLTTAVLTLAGGVIAESGEGDVLHQDRGSIHLLKRGEMELTIMDPDHTNRVYQGVRFSPIAAVLQAKYKGLPYLLCPEDVSSPVRGDMPGLAMEFDLVSPDGPPGFTEAAMGNSFLKVGVGALKKAGPGYRFMAPYEFAERPVTETDWNKRGVSYSQAATNTGGYGYKLTADLVLDSSSFSIHYTLLNTGSKRMKTIQYHHNFLNFGGTPVGPDYVVEFPYAPVMDGWYIKGNALSFNTPIKGFLKLDTHPPQEYTGSHHIDVRQIKTGQTLRIASSLPSGTCTLFVTSDKLCPEQFIELEIAPGESVSWKRSYVFGLNDAAINAGAQH